MSVHFVNTAPSNQAQSLYAHQREYYGYLAHLSDVSRYVWPESRDRNMTIGFTPEC